MTLSGCDKMTYSGRDPPTVLISTFAMLRWLSYSDIIEGSTVVDQLESSVVGGVDGGPTSHDEKGAWSRSNCCMSSCWIEHHHHHRLGEHPGVRLADGLENHPGFHLAGGPHLTQVSQISLATTQVSIPLGAVPGSKFHPFGGSPRYYSSTATTVEGSEGVCDSLAYIHVAALEPGCEVGL